VNNIPVSHAHAQANMLAIALTKQQIKERIPITYGGHFDMKLNRDFDLSELDSAIQKLKCSTPGPDEIPAQVIKQLNEIGKKKLLIDINNIWNTSQIPKIWRTATVIPILKPGKNAQDPNSYRPISLTSCLAKTMERLILARMLAHINKANKFHKEQAGFLPHRGCDTLLAMIHHYISLKQSERDYIVAVSFDIKAAYCNVWPDGVTYKLLQHGFSGNLVKWIDIFLQERFFKVKWRQVHSIEMKSGRGLPQGTVLSPILFQIYMSDIYEILPSEVKCFIYADDVYLFGADKCETTLHRTLQKAINCFQTWCETWKLDIQTTKTNIIDFSRKRKKLHFKLQYKNEELKWVKEIKILGINFDNKLNFNAYINNLKKKTLKKIGALKYIASQQRGVRTNNLIKIVNATIRSKLEYGYSVLVSAPQYTLNRIETIYNIAMRSALGVPKQTPIPILRREMNEISMTDRITLLAKKFYVKHSALKELSPLSDILNDFQYKNPPKYQHKWPLAYKFRNLFESINIYKTQLIPTTTIDFGKNLSIEIKTDGLPFQMKLSDNDRQRCYTEFKENEWNTKVIIATDGAKGENYTTIAIWNSTLREKIAGRIPNENSIFSAEAIAIWLAISRWSNVNTETILLTDSKSVLQAMRHANPKSPTIIKRILKECEINNKPKITFIWTPSHCGIQENEIVDKLAGDAKNSHLILNWIAPEDILQQVTREYKNKIQEEFEKTKYLEHYKYLQFNNPSYRNMLRNRKEEVMLTKVKTKTLPCGKFLHKCKLIETPLCSACGDDESIDHLLLCCKKYTNLRCDLRRSIGIIPLSFDWLVLDDCRNKKKYRAIIKFLIAAGFG